MPPESMTLQPEGIGQLAPDPHNREASNASPMRTKMSASTVVRTVPSDQLFEPLLDSREAAALLLMHHKTLERKARKGEVPGYQIAGRWCFRVSELDRWLKGQVNSSSQSRRVN